MLSTVGGSRLTILAYHRVLPEPDPLRATICDVETFNWQMELLARHFHVLSLRSALQRLDKGTLPARAVCITFDDGYADNVTIALPILQRYGLPATFFIATGFLDGGRMWNDSIVEAMRSAAGHRLDLTDVGLAVYAFDDPPGRRAAITDIIQNIKHLPQDERESVTSAIVTAIGAVLPTDLMMRGEDVRRLVGEGMDVGGHTVSHPILLALDRERAMAEIRDGKAQLESLAGRDVEIFAYPNGKPGQDYDSSHIDLVRDCGFTAAVTTSRGAVMRDSDLFQLARLTPWDTTPRKFMLRLLQNFIKTRPVLCQGRQDLL